MFNLKETEKYNVNTKEILTDAISDAYDKSLSTLPKEKPDTFLLISSCFSFGVLTYMTLMTALKQTDAEKIAWFAIAAVCAAFFVFMIVRYIRQYSAYKKDVTTVNKREKKITAFLNLLEADSLPEKMPAADLAKKVSSLLGKQSDNIFNNALRNLASMLNAKNNPSDLICKNLTPMGTMFPATRQRFYFRPTLTSYTFYDADFSAPEGELECDTDDLVAYGQYDKFSDFDKSAISKAGKVRSDSYILKLSDGTSFYFFEFQSDDYPKLKKALPMKKEL
ncbi:MAG: hypothetical protein II748_01575 [Clostridia bacterium]|jgi:hypothetical protein|nr:hypothetical protein [Clostridia bacterium]